MTRPSDPRLDEHFRKVIDVELKQWAGVTRSAKIVLEQAADNAIHRITFKTRWRHIP